MSSSSENTEPPPSEDGNGSALPPLSDREFKAYNRLAEKMDYFHEHFRKMWKTLHEACVANKRPAGMTLREFIDEGLLFCQYLTAHHNIEETYFFPMLARKMPEFRSAKSGRSDGDGKNAALLRQHEEIHSGMDLFEEYLKKCLSRETELDLRVMKEKMDSWGEVLWTHLDQEVKTLGAENMRKYWSVEEVRSFPI